MRKFLLLIIPVFILCHTCSYPRAKAQKEGSFLITLTDTLPKKSEKTLASAQKDAEKVKSGILKKIANALSFRKNIRARQRAFILETVAALDFRDTIVARSENLKRLIDTISKNQDVRFDKLISLVDSLKNDLNSRSKDGSKINPAPPIDTAFKGESEPPFDYASDITPSFIEKESENEKEKRQTLSLIKPIIAAGNKKTGTRFKLQNKIEICGYYNAYAPYNFKYPSVNLLSTLIYDSLFAVGKTGDLIKLINWQNDQLIDDAKKAGCRVIYSIVATGTTDLGLLLSNSDAPENFINGIRSLHDNYSADGINIHFAELSSTDRLAFFKILRYTSIRLKKLYPGFRIYVTLPVFDQQRVYDVKAMDTLVDRFCIDFSVKRSTQAAPLAALNGRNTNTLSTSISYYLKQQVPPEKFIVNLAYHGTKWIIRENNNPPDKFVQYLSYKAIRDKTTAQVFYDEASTSAYIDSSYQINRVNKAKSRIWFDDENTLAPKYDFILQNGLGGVGFSYLGYDGVYGELLDLLIYKFIKIDSSFTEKHIETNLSVLQKAKRQFVLYQYILQHPCQPCFEKMIGTDRWDSVAVYVEELKLDSIVKAHNMEMMRDGSKKNTNISGTRIQTQIFLYLTNKLNDIFFWITVSFLFLLLIALIIYLHSIRRKGTDWNYKKTVGWIMLALSVGFLWSLFNFFFTTDLVPFFGVTTKYLSNVHPKYIRDANGNVTCLPLEDCVNISLWTLHWIIAISLVVGALLAKYLILPLLGKEEVP